jgi:hypothetical protein
LFKSSRISLVFHGFRVARTSDCLCAMMFPS